MFLVFDSLPCCVLLVTECTDFINSIAYCQFTIHHSQFTIPAWSSPSFVESFLHSASEKIMVANRNAFLIKNNVFMNQLFQLNNCLLAFIYYLFVDWLIKIVFLWFVFGDPDNIEYPL